MTAKIRGNILIGVLWAIAYVLYPQVGRTTDVATPCDPEPTTNMPISYGDIITCQIDFVGDLDSFVFVGTAGELIEWTLTDRTTFGGEPRAQLFDPMDPINPIDTLSPVDTGVTHQLRLTKSGTYQIRVRELGDDETVSYNLALQRLFPTPPDALVLCVGCVLQEGIEVVADSDVFVFDGTINDVVELTLTDRTTFGGEPKAELYGPDENRVQDANGDPIVLTPTDTGQTIQLPPLPATGTYTILVRERGDDETVSYNLALQRLFPTPPDARFLCLGCGVEDSIAPVADSDVSNFDGASGCLVELTLADRTGFGGEPVAQLYGPDQNPVLDSNGAPVILAPVDASETTDPILLDNGTYTVLVREQGDDEVNNYSLSLQYLSGDCPADRPEISVITPNIPLALAFPATPVGDASLTQTTTVCNDGGADLLIGTVTVGDADAGQFLQGTDGCSSQTLASTQCCTVEMSFAPTSAGDKVATLVIPSNDADENPVNVALNGTGFVLEEPDITVLPASLVVDLGDVPVNTTSAAQTVTVRNDGEDDLDIGLLSLSGTDADQFATVDGCSGQTVPPTQNCTVDVTCTPTSVGPKVATLAIPSNDPDENPVNVSLNCTGRPVEPDIMVDPISVDLGDVPINTTSAAQTVTVSNVGGADLVIGSLSLSGTDADQFATVDGCSGQTVPPTQNCTVDVTCTPTSAGPKVATLAIPSNDLDEDPVSVSLNCTGRDEGGEEPDISVLPTSLVVDLGDVPINTTSAAQTVTVSNAGGADLVIGVLSLSGTDADQFATVDGCSGQTVPPTQNCTVDVTCTPTSAGPKVATLAIPSNDPDEDPVNVSLSCTGRDEGLPVLSASPVCGMLAGKVTLPISLNKNGQPVASTGFTLHFPTDKFLCQDPDNLPEVACSPAALASGFSCTRGPVDCVAGTVQVAITPPIQQPPLPELPEGEIAQVMLTVNPESDPGEAMLCSEQPTECMPLTFSTVDCGDTGGQNISCGTQDGCIDVVMCLQGDSNGDKSLTTADVTYCILRFFDVVEKVSACEDCNGDGRKTTADVTCTILCLFGQCPTLP